MAKRSKQSGTEPRSADSYAHPEAKALLRPDVGTQAQFKKKKEPARYRYDSSLSPALEWDGSNQARDLGEWLIARIEEAAKLHAPHRFENPRELADPRGNKLVVHGLDDAVQQLKRLSKPFLDWTGKAERLSFDVPTLPLFVHERLSTKAILETLKGHKRDKSTQHSMFELFGDPELPVHEQVLRAYEHQGGWQNRMVLGDSLVVMNSLLRYEGLGGQVQMIYMDPPYGVKFGSNFQPFVRKRDVKHGDDEDMTREPEMVKAYRDTWELGLHSYLTYMRDRLLLARDLLSPSGSIFVQISDENLHHVRELIDEIFGAEHFVSVVAFRTTTGKGSSALDSTVDFLLWYAKSKDHARTHASFIPRSPVEDANLRWLELADGSRRKLTDGEAAGLTPTPANSRVFRPNPLTSQSASATTVFEYEFGGQVFRPGKGGWKTNLAGMRTLENAGRLIAQGNTLGFIRYLDDFPFQTVNNVWDDTRSSGYGDPKVYAVQTNTRVVQRCMQMTTDPGDLVLDPTCGSGTTAYVAEQWGRRWITIDTSRVPLALARQRLLTATYPYYELKDAKRGPVGGFVYERKQNKKGEEVGGIVPHVTLKSIANNEPPAEEVLVDRPEVDKATTRVTGPFCFEATIPTPMDWDGPVDDSRDEQQSHGSYLERMLEVLRRNPSLQLGGGKSVQLLNVRAPARTLVLSAEATVAATASGQKATLADAAQESIERSSKALPYSERPVAIVFGPENGAISQALVYQALQEAHLKSYAHLYVIGFAIQPNARGLIENAEAAVDIPATYVQATPDIIMGDLLKTMRSSQIFSVCGLPDVKLHKLPLKAKGEPALYAAELRALDVFDPTDMSLDERKGDDVPAWFLDTDYNGLCFHVTQAFFPRTAAWDDLKRSLKGQYDDAVWDHLAGTTSAPFEAGEHGQVAIKVIDDRGNELLVVKKLREAQS